MRGAHEEARHAQAAQEALSEPDQGIVALKITAISVDDTEEERAEADENGPDDDERPAVTCIEESSDHSRQNQDHERLRRAHEVEEVAVSRASTPGERNVMDGLQDLHLLPRQEMLHVVRRVRAVCVDLIIVSSELSMLEHG